MFNFAFAQANTYVDIYIHAYVEIISAFSTIKDWQQETDNLINKRKKKKGKHF